MSGADRKLKTENYDAARPRWIVAARVVADHEDVNAVQVQFAGGGETRAGAGLIRARKLSFYLGHVAAGLSVHELANLSKATRKTIREHIQAVEDERDDGSPLAVELDALTAEIQLILARKDYVAQRRAVTLALAADQGVGGMGAPEPLPPLARAALDPALDRLLATWHAADTARAAWAALCAAGEAALLITHDDAAGAAVSLVTDLREAS
ncbi:hypothetical protein [Caulobacter hibisci]|uniref:Uncharacterized protein n=1 Tax=Caulobacter hibisci TaxID=2035993 RepID=A0ABS0SXW1_9CAUL|nr:hypothetical protein [Caulobacter hibisci]MBI1684443.1 hypothetical protein [Caulobacter hibisci]